jgi:hypothetical protein
MCFANEVVCDYKTYALRRAPGSSGLVTTLHEAPFNLSYVT